MLQIVGYIVLSYVALSITYWTWKMFQSYSWLATPFDFKKIGDWAIVTGGTDGIGMEYVNQLADCGLNIIVVGRNPEKLKMIRASIESKGRLCETVKADLSSQDEIKSATGELKILCSRYAVGVLVNNAGVSYDHPEYYHQLDSSDLDRMVNVNCSAIIFFTSVVVGQMSQRKAGIIINVASDFGRFPGPLMSLYCATKAFVIHFSKCIRYEYAPNNIHVQTICPQLVTTKMSKIRKSGFFAPTPRKFVSHALCTVTRMNECNGYFGHEIQSVICRMLPERIVSNYVFGIMNKLRLKALQKK